MKLKAKRELMLRTTQHCISLLNAYWYETVVITPILKAFKRQAIPEHFKTSNTCPDFSTFPSICMGEVDLKIMRI